MNPDSLIVIAAGRAAHGRPARPAVFRAPHDDRCAVDDVLVFRVDDDGRQIAATDAAEGARIGSGGRRVTDNSGPGDARAQRPVRAAVARLVETDRPRSARRIHGGDHRVNHLRITRGDRDVGFEYLRQAIRELRPRRATVRRLVDSAGAGPRRVGPERGVLIERRLLLPQRGVHRVGICGIDPYFVRAGVLVLVQHLLERAAAVRRAKHAALGVRSIGMAERRHEQPVRIGGVDVDVRDHLRVVEPEMRPRAAGVVGAVHPVAGGEIGPDDPRPGADVDDGGVGRRDRDGPDRAGRLAIEQRLPVRAVVARAP